MNEKIKELQKRTIIVLEKTKKEVNKYANERKIIDEYLIQSKDKDDENFLREWEEFLIKIEEKTKDLELKI